MIEYEMQCFLTLVSSVKKKLQIASFLCFRHIFISFIKQFSIGKDCISVFVTIFFFWLKEAFFLGPNQSLHLCKPIVLQVIFYEIYELFLHSNQKVAPFFIYVGYINAELWVIFWIVQVWPTNEAVCSFAIIFNI